MSTFTVKLNYAQSQGQMDIDPSTDTSQNYGVVGTQIATSKQRTIYAAGPHRKYRLLKDGETFVDCNYWKKFAVYNATTNPYGCDASEAFISITTDDGSIWSDVASENTYAEGYTVVLGTNYGTVIGDGYIDFIATYGTPAKFLQVQNLDTVADTVTGKLNGDANMTFTILAGATQTFNVGDMMISKLELKASAGATDAKWIATLTSTPTS